MTVAIIGGGAVGVTTAQALASQDIPVTLYEASTLASGSTGRAAGIIYGAHADPLNAQLGQTSIRTFRELADAHGVEFTETPYLWFTTEPGRHADAIETQVQHLTNRDIDASLIDSQTVTDTWPALTAADLHTVAHTGVAGRLDPASYVDIVADLALQSGATIHEHTPATPTTNPPGVTVDGTHHAYDAVAVTAGAHTTRLLAEAGLSIPMKPYRVQALTGPGPPIPMYWDVTNGYYARPHPTGVLAGDGTIPTEASPDTYDRTADTDFLEDTTAKLTHRLRQFDTVAESWAGLCTATPDQDPLLGPITSDIYVGTGWHGQGVMRAPATGRLLADAIKTASVPEPRFDPTRFTDVTDFDITEGMHLPEEP